ncbi:STAS domain-containing protein [Candidatus Uabimicrobium sp. HlEnr_7]|uniref:STAS domain-containing protein n=1 Tax=Candidatus Uabimicrobium helgolandensis TaxID=3095367 RepID=UPI0035565C6F
MEDIYDDEKGLRIQITKKCINESEALFFEVTGSIDTHTCSIHLLDNVITQKVQETAVKHVVFDLENLHHINSTGIGFLIKFADDFSKQNQGKIYVVNADDEKQQLFDMLGLWPLFVKVDNGTDIASYIS